MFKVQMTVKVVFHYIHNIKNATLVNYGLKICLQYVKIFAECATSLFVCAVSTSNRKIFVLLFR